MSKDDDGSSYEEFIMDHLPWLTGSLGTVALDFTVSLLLLYSVYKILFADPAPVPLSEQAQLR